MNDRAGSPQQLGMFTPRTEQPADPAGRARRVEEVSADLDLPVPDQLLGSELLGSTRRDPVEGARLRDDAIDQVEAGTRTDWNATARRAVAAVADRLERFTTDDVWDELDRIAGGRWDPPEPRAMGAVMRWAARQGIARPTRETTPSERPDCHRRPVRIWTRGG